MNATHQTLEALLRTLLAEEETLALLVDLAVQEQQALMMSDYESIESVSARMLNVAENLDSHERVREALMTAIDAGGATLADLVPVARSLGVEGFNEARTTLLTRLSDLHEAQERNARLILGAVKIRERWVNVIGGLASAATYGSSGRQDAGHRRGFVSKSA